MKKKGGVRGSSTSKKSMNKNDVGFQFEEFASKKSVMESWSNPYDKVDKRYGPYAKNVNFGVQRKLLGQSKRQKRQQLLWTGHNYMGPGNPLENGDPTTNADNVARTHDYAYAHAWSESDIKAANEKAKSQFLEHPTEFSSLVGYSGIAIKKIVEKFTGTLYPNIAELDRTARKRSVMTSIRKKWFNAA